MNGVDRTDIHTITALETLADINYRLGVNYPDRISPAYRHAPGASLALPLVNLYRGVVVDRTASAIHAQRCCNNAECIQQVLYHSSFLSSVRIAENEQTNTHCPHPMHF